MDQRTVEGRADVLVFSTAALEKPMEVTGRVRVRLYASSEAPDTDFTAKLCDVYPDGRSMLLCDGIIRARHRLSMKSETFLAPRKVVAFEIDLWSTSVIFNRGHRIRVDISSSNAPRFEPNPNTDRGGKPRKATQAVFCDARYPSALVLQLVGGAHE
jgi:putative CocE/NonD family hydrolase